ncbi:ORF99 [black bullhead herpesvirus]|uniref:ORF99 n=1 Tax=black bullhead herpesvirus TaxID=508441 RepID=A0A2H5AJH9_9VIRU|nr:ORF99 [black bullhead herpesvirus]AUG72298.1 ORF99 [black bullhead herpesvirus]
MTFQFNCWDPILDDISKTIQIATVDRQPPTYWNYITAETGMRGYELFGYPSLTQSGTIPGSPWRPEMSTLSWPVPATSVHEDVIMAEPKVPIQPRQHRRRRRSRGAGRKSVHALAPVWSTPSPGTAVRQVPQEQRQQPPTPIKTGSLKSPGAPKSPRVKRGVTFADACTIVQFDREDQPDVVHGAPRGRVALRPPNL